MKFVHMAFCLNQLCSRPLTQGAWIEITRWSRRTRRPRRPLTQGAWIEIWNINAATATKLGRPLTQGAWIEMRLRAVR